MAKNADSNPRCRKLNSSIKPPLVGCRNSRRVKKNFYSPRNGYLTAPFLLFSSRQTLEMLIAQLHCWNAIFCTFWRGSCILKKPSGLRNSRCIWASVLLVAYVLDGGSQLGCNRLQFSSQLTTSQFETTGSINNAVRGWRDEWTCVRLFPSGTALRYAFGNAKCENNRALSVRAAIKAPLTLHAQGRRKKCNYEFSVRTTSLLYVRPCERCDVCDSSSLLI